MPKMSTTPIDGSIHESAMSSPTQDKRNEALHRIRTAGSVSIPPELFEQLYLAPHHRVKGQLRQTFGNPTPLGETRSIIFHFALFTTVADPLVSLGWLFDLRYATINGLARLGGRWRTGCRKCVRFFSYIKAQG
jgi:hypothetical protein